MADKSRIDTLFKICETIEIERLLGNWGVEFRVNKLPLTPYGRTRKNILIPFLVMKYVGENRDRINANFKSKIEIKNRIPRSNFTLVGAEFEEVFYIGLQYKSRNMPLPDFSKSLNFSVEDFNSLEEQIDEMLDV